MNPAGSSPGAGRSRRIRLAFEQAGAEGRKLFIGFTVAGDPDYDTCRKIVSGMIESGTDILELGLPFSDPVADGPTIQLGNGRAIESGMNTDRLFFLVRDIRKESDVPIVLLVYANMVFRRGIDRFYREAAAAGVDGILVVDVPVEEAGEYLSAADAHTIDPIMMITPTTTPDRMRTILSCACGFVYLVTVCGVTGARESLSAESAVLLETVRRHTDLPLAPGFGISTPEQADALYAANADAVIVGSAIIQRIEENLGDCDAICSAVSAYISGMKRT